MIPGEVFTAEGDIILNADRQAITLLVANTGDRPVQVGSHYHFACRLIAPQPMARGWIFPPEPPCALNLARPVRSTWCPTVACAKFMALTPK